MSKFKIRLAEERDAPLLPAVERSAGRTFLQHPKLAWIADDGTQSVEQHLDFIKRGLEWVAVDGDAEDVPVGFLNGFLNQETTSTSTSTSTTFHIQEISVEAEYQGKGIGRSLMETARQWAAGSGCEALTLTTFRNVPWNEGFYRSIGFRTLGSSELTRSLEVMMKKEADAGLALEDRCAMCLCLDSGGRT